MNAQVPSSEKDAMRQRVDELFAAMNAHDVDAIVAMHASDAVLRHPALPHPASGRPGIAEGFRAIFRALPDIHFPLDEVRLYVADERRAAVTWRFTGTMTGRIEPPGYAPTGKSCSVEGACVYEFVADPDSGEVLLDRHTIIYDSLGLLQQLGIMPRAESGAAKVTAGLQRTTTLVSHALRRQSVHH